MTYFLMGLWLISKAYLCICLFFSFELISSEITLPLNTIFSALVLALYIIYVENETTGDCPKLQIYFRPFLPRVCYFTVSVIRLFKFW